MRRLFVALSLPDDVMDALARLQTGMRGARWIPQQNYHLTLAFIGETDRHGLNDIASALASVSAPAFDLRLRDCGFFGDKKPRALWAGVAANPHLAHLQAKVETAQKRAGFPLEKRKFTPHVTLAYLHGATPESAAGFCAANGLFSAGPFPLREFHLFESHLGSEAAHYEIIASYALPATGDFAERETKAAI